MNQARFSQISLKLFWVQQISQLKIKHTKNLQFIQTCNLKKKILQLLWWSAKANVFLCWQNHDLSFNRNRPFPNYLRPLWVSLSAHPFICKSIFIHMKMSWICMWMKIDLHMNGWALRLTLKKRPEVIQKWPLFWLICINAFPLLTSSSVLSIDSFERLCFSSEISKPGPKDLHMRYSLFCITSQKVTLPYSVCYIDSGFQVVTGKIYCL